MDIMVLPCLSRIQSSCLFPTQTGSQTMMWMIDQGVFCAPVPLHNRWRFSGARDSPVHGHNPKRFNVHSRVLDQETLWNLVLIWMQLTSCAHSLLMRCAPSISTNFAPSFLAIFRPHSGEATRSCRPCKTTIGILAASKALTFVMGIHEHVIPQQTEQLKLICKLCLIHVWWTLL